MDLIRELGRGGFAVVEEVEMPNGVRLARKTLSPASHILQFVGTDHLRERFLREVKYQSAVAHPNVVRIFDADLSVDPPYCIMELAESTLADEIRADRTLGGDPSKALFDILAGLQALEELGYTHRDLKPQNVLKIKNADGTCRYAISDFGLVTAGSANSTTLTGTGVNGGTPYYAAPELNNNFRRATIAADIYAFGAILHDIFDGSARVPYSELSMHGPVGLVAETCTRKNPIRRYSSITQLREALYDALNQGAISFKSANEERAVALLQESRLLSDDEWDYIYFVLDENESKSQSNVNIFRFIGVDHISALANSAPQLLKAVGMGYAAHATRMTFDFNYCDVISSRLEKFFEIGDTELKGNTLLALLELGTSHNRWVVERSFVQLAGINCSSAVVKRFLSEVDVQKYNLSKAVAHLELSISISRLSLHPLIVAALVK